MPKSACRACGHLSEESGTTATACPKCGTSAETSGRPATPMLTLIEDMSSTGTSGGASSSARRLAAGALPRSIDGYEILSLLGQGGMGAVYLAYEPLLDRVLALKVLSYDRGNDARAAFAARFLSEAALTGKLGHAGIIPIYRTGFDSTHGYYYTMRYVAGKTLGEIVDLLAARDPQTCETYSLNKLLGIFINICEAVGFAHQHGILHRDIKPANVMITGFGEVLVLDWGLAKETDVKRAASDRQDFEVDIAEKLSQCRARRGTAAQMFLNRSERPSGTSILRQMQSIRPENSKQTPKTHAHQILGTPGYLSPEQGEGHAELTPASDVYSLGVLLYELLTLQMPVKGDSTEAIVTNTILGEIVPIQQHENAVRLSKALCEIVMRALARKPEDRYQNARELADELSLYLEGKSTWKPLSVVRFDKSELPDGWLPLRVAPEFGMEGDGIVLTSVSGIRCTKHSLGDFRCEFNLWAEASPQWMASIGISEVLPAGIIEPRYEIRIGVEERPIVELLRNGTCVQRRFDVRLQSTQKYRIKMEVEHDHIRLFVEDRKYLDYREVFAQTGGALDISGKHGRVHIESAALESRGAPLNLSFMALPDRLYRSGKFMDARELYRQLATSHPDREEGLIALYKAGLCSADLDDQQSAFADFTKLEGTMFDHCCALGLAHIGMRDGNIDWAWEALKNGYRRHSSPDIRDDMWFALLSLVEKLDLSRADEKVRRYEELLAELNPEHNEAAQLAFDILDTVQIAQGQDAVRGTARRMLETSAKNAFVAYEALMALGHTGIDEASMDLAASTLDGLLTTRIASMDYARLHLLRAEICIAQNDLDSASRHLRETILDAGFSSSDGLWAKGWQLLILYLKGQYQQALTDIHESLIRFRRAPVHHISYFQLLEGLSYLGKGQTRLASAAFAKVIQNDTIWKTAASHYLRISDAASFESAVSRQWSVLTVEACFLTGEMFLRAGNINLANQYFTLCVNLPMPRAMVTRLAKSRLMELSSKGQLIGS